MTVTAELDPGMPPEDAREDAVALGAWSPLSPDAALFEAAWLVEDRYGFSYRDSLIVASARRLGCSVLLTEDLQDGQEPDGLVVRSPFTTEPPAGPGA